MSSPRVFIDGHAGTTGLRIRDWLAEREDLDVWTLPEEDRKSDEARREAIGGADLTVLCLPDDAARTAAGWAADSGARLIDASSSHRVADGWVYGLPELVKDQRDAIRDAQLVSNPGCYASAFIALVRPLIDSGLIGSDAPLSIHGLSGYSGGGKALIARWESPEEGRVGLRYEAPYALERIHKHIPEMKAHARLVHAPQFVPAVGAFACGMRVEVPIHQSLLAGGADADGIWQTLVDRYRDETFLDVAAYAGFEPIDDFTLDPTRLNDTNRMELHVIPNPAGHVLLVALLDNLGKGAAGVAIQSLNLMLGLDEAAGLPA